jgi:peptide/nickel transport system substrate-binding protein
MRFTKTTAAFASGVLTLGLAFSTSGVAFADDPVTTSAAPSGTLSIAADQEPDCLDWISSCAGSSWGAWMVLKNTLPQVYDIVPAKGGSYTYKPSNLMASAPTLQTSPQQVVTYKLNPKAVWSDGTPITSADLKYTWEQITTGSDIYDTTGYDKIASIDTPDPQTAVATYSEPYASWQAMFGGGYGIMPSHLLAGKDRDAIMKDGYPFSGGPWIASWEKGVSITLTPNTRYWGKQPTIGKVIFKFITDTSASFQAFKAGEVSVMYPQPQPDALLQIKGGLKGSTVKATGDTGNVEALWMNNSAAPFDNINFRKAVAYSLDRDAIVNRLFGTLGVKKAQNSFNPPIVASYSTPAGFAKYTKNLAKASAFMKKAGYKKSGGYWSKDGERASFTLKTTVGNQRRSLTAQILQSAFKAAGIEMKIQTVEAGDLFGEQLPAGDYQMGLYAQVATTPDPGLCVIFCSTNIPSAANENSGQNWTGTNVKGLDTLLEQVDTTAVVSKRQKISKAADLLIGASVTSLPLDPLPNILIYKNTIKGKIQDNAVSGPFSKMNYWTIKG